MWKAELDTLSRALFACGCVGAADHPRLATFLSSCGPLRETTGAALLVALWAVAQRSYLPVVAALEASRRADGKRPVLPRVVLRSAVAAEAADGRVVDADLALLAA